MFIHAIQSFWHLTILGSNIYLILYEISPALFSLSFVSFQIESSVCDSIYLHYCEVVHEKSEKDERKSATGPLK